MAFRPTAKRLMLLRVGLGKNIAKKGNPEGPTDSVLALVLSAAYCLSRRAVPTRNRAGRSQGNAGRAAHEATVWLRAGRWLCLGTLTGS